MRSIINARAVAKCLTRRLKSHLKSTRCGGMLAECYGSSTIDAADRLFVPGRGRMTLTTNINEPKKRNRNLEKSPCDVTI
jgi:hypothetical protein